MGFVGRWGSELRRAEGPSLQPGLGKDGLGLWPARGVGRAHTQADGRLGGQSDSPTSAFVACGRIGQAAVDTLGASEIRIVARGGGAARVLGRSRGCGSGGIARGKLYRHGCKFHA